MNKIFIKGRLTKSPELKHITDEMSVTKFSVAVDRKAKAGEEKKTDFINCTAWNKQGEFIEKYFSKGQEIAIVGRLEVNNYEKDGERKTSVYVVVEEVEFVGSKKKEQKEDIENVGDLEIDFNYTDDSDLPF